MVDATHLDERSMMEWAKESAGNWRRFDSFVWWRASSLDLPEDWTIYYTYHRDSGLLDRSNAEQIRRALESFTESDDPDVLEESHSHWAVGHIDGFSIRVIREGKITEAFRAYRQLMESLEGYPILNEHDYSEREYEATVENIVQAAWRLKDDYALPEGWNFDVYSWLSEHDESEIENADDQGGFPSEEALRRAIETLGYKRVG